MRCSIRTRLTLWYSAVMIVALTAFSAGVLLALERLGRAQFDSELASLGAATSKVMQEELGESHNLSRAVAETRSSIDVPGRAVAILDVSGRALGAHWQGFRYEVTSPAPVATSQLRFTTIEERGTAWRVLQRRESSAEGDYVILVAGPLNQLARQQSLLTRMLVIAMSLVVLAAAAVCAWVASSALRPVTMMAAEAELITSHSPEWRLRAAIDGDELGQLARAFNRLLDRLGSALQLQRQFMADASHELRTPVSVIQTAAEVTLENDAREQWEYREALGIVNEQSARLSRMVDDMMVLARADAGGYPVTKRPLYLEEIASESVRAASVIAATRHVQFVTTLQADVVVNGDDGLLRRLFTNLLNNAVQYSETGGTVAFDVSTEGTDAIVRVSDNGPGIATSDRERIFDRFVRLDPARSATSGAGLGLPIARWIAERHDGTLTLEGNESGGCTFVARLPLKRTVSVRSRTDADGLGTRGR